MKPKTLRVGQRDIGDGNPPFIVAELSGNHNQDLARALRLVECAAEAGADAVKLQTYTADTITLDHDGPGFVIESGPWKGRRLYDLYDEAHTPWDWHEQIFAHARSLGLIAFSAPFDPTAVTFLEGLDCPLYKIASFECVDTPLIRTVASTGKPLIISTGLAGPDEIADAVSVARAAGCAGVSLLHCVSAYPAPASDYHLNRILDLARDYDVPAGLSDHTLGNATAIAAVALGACIIEKHMTLARSDAGPDAEFSSEPNEFAALVRDCRTAWEAMAPAPAYRSAAEMENMQFRRSLYIVRDIAAGALLTADHVRSIRPGDGLPPAALDQVVGRRAARDLKRGSPLTWDDVVKN